MIFKKWPHIFDEENYKKFLNELYIGLSGLKLNENFQSITYEDIYLSAGLERSLNNSIGIIPKHRIITKQDAYSQFQDGDWSKDFLKITADTNCTVTIIYLL